MSTRSLQKAYEDIYTAAQLHLLNTIRSELTTDSVFKSALPRCTARELLTGLTILAYGRWTALERPTPNHEQESFECFIAQIEPVRSTAIKEIEEFRGGAFQ